MPQADGCVDQSDHAIDLSESLSDRGLTVCRPTSRSPGRIQIIQSQWHNLISEQTRCVRTRSQGQAPQHRPLPLVAPEVVCEDNAMSTSPLPHIDPELMRQLTHARPGELVEGVFMLRNLSSQPCPDASETRDQVQRLLSSARRRCGARDDRLTIFENLQSFALRAPRELVQAVLESPDIASAMANQQPESLLIEPICPAPPARRSRGPAPRSADISPTRRSAKRREKTPPSQ